MKHLYILLLLVFLTGKNIVAAQEKDSILTVTDSTSNSIKIVKTLPGAYLNSSCGNDRLGGPKMGFLNEDIPLVVEEATEDLYKVILSDNRYAYIPKGMVADTVVAEEALAVCPTQSVIATNTGKRDRIKFSLPERKPYIIRENSHPRQLVIEIFGVQNNSNWMTQHLDLKSIKNIEVIQSDSDITTYTINLNGSSSWGYSAKYEKNTLVVEIKHAPEFTLKGMVIGIDAGHGGPKSTGAVGRTTKAKEKELNLSMAYMLKEQLEKQGAKVVLSRVGDENMDMSERKAKFLENDIDLMVSIHCNAAGNSAHGTSTYYKHTQNRELAKSILNRLVEIDGVEEWGLVGNFNFSLNAPTEYPAVLVETLFLSYQPDEEKLVNPTFRKQMMRKVADGIKDYLKICKKADKANK